MGVVTALRAGRRGRIAVYVDGDYVCSVSEALLARRRLFRVSSSTRPSSDALRHEASAERVLGDAHRLLAQRQRSREELRRRLLQKEHTEQAVGGVARAPRRRRPPRRRRLRRAPSSPTSGASAGWGARAHPPRSRRSRGRAAPSIDAALGEAGRGAELERALAVLARGGPPRPPLEAARRRAYATLQRRGFSGAVCYAAVKRWSEPGAD